MVKSYDVNSFLLAEQFMQDRPQGISADRVRAFTHDLALEIQEAVESWWEQQERTGWSGKFDNVPAMIDDRE